MADRLSCFSEEQMKDVNLNNRKAIMGPSTCPTRTFADKCHDSVSASPLTQAFCHMARCLVFRHAGGGCHVAKSQGEIRCCSVWDSLLVSIELISHANCPTAHAGTNHYRPGGSCIALATFFEDAGVRSFHLGQHLKSSLLETQGKIDGGHMISFDTLSLARQIDECFLRKFAHDRRLPGTGTNDFWRIRNSTCSSSHHGSYQKWIQGEIPFWGLRFRKIERWEIRDDQKQACSRAPACLRREGVFPKREPPAQGRWTLIVHETDPQRFGK